LFIPKGDEMTENDYQVPYVEVNVKVRCWGSSTDEEGIESMKGFWDRGKWTIGDSSHQLLEITVSTKQREESE